MISMWKTACPCTNWKKLDHGLKETRKHKSLLSTYGISSILFFPITVLNLIHSGGLHALWIVITPGSARITMRWSMCWRFSCLLTFVSFFSCFFCSFPSFVGSLHAALQNGVTWRAFLGILQVKATIFFTHFGTLRQQGSQEPNQQVCNDIARQRSLINNRTCMLHPVQTSSNGLLATIQR